MRSLLILSVFSCSALLGAAPSSAARVYFEPNRGQTGAAARFIARAGSGALLFTDEGVVLRRAGAQTDLRLELSGASPQSRWAPGAEAAGTTSYVVGRDRSRWIRDVPHYETLLRRGVYPGIDAAWHGDEGRIEYDFVLAPGADPSRIAIRARGAARLSLEADGGLRIETAGGPLRQHAPYVYQLRPDGSRAAVPGRFRLIARDTIGFTVGAYDRSQPLTIDPVLESSTYLGGSGEDRIVALTGATRYAGTTTSIDFPGSSFKRRFGKDVVVNTGYSTWVIGGSGDEEVTAAYLLSGGEVAVVGYTNSKDLPTNISVLPRYNSSTKVAQPEYGGGASDGFFLWISDNSGNSPAGVYLTYVGGAGDDRLTGVVPGGGGYAMVGYTAGGGLPSSQNQYQGLQDSPAGGIDGFLLVIESMNFSPAVAYATYFGGTGDDKPAAIAAVSGTYLIAGETTSPDFPLGNSTVGTLHGPSDAFVLRITPTGTNIAISGGMLIGGSGWDRATALTVQGSKIVVAGATSSTDLPVASPVQASYGGGDSDAFLARLALDFSQTLFLSYIGGSGADEASSLSTDFLGNLFVGGWTASTDFPVSNAAQPTFGGGPDDGFLLHFTLDGSLYAATYFGGSGSDRILGVYAAGDHSVWATGQTTSPDLPLRGARQNALSGASDGFLARTSAALLTAGRAIGAKGVRAQAVVYLGLLNGAVDAAVTVTSLNPANVLVSPATGPPASTAVLTQYYQPNSRLYAVYCQVESGGADLTIAAEGYPSQTIHADCFPIQARIANSAGAVFSYDQNRNLTTTSWSAAGVISVTLYAVNPDLATDAAAVYALDGSPLTAQPQSSDSSVLKISPAAPTYTGYINLTAQGVSTGNAAIGFSATGFTVANTLPVAVVPPVSISEMAIPTGFQIGSGVLNGVPPQGTTVTITSDDPSRLLLSTDPSVPGSASIVTSNGGVYYQALAEGDVTVHAAATGLAPVSGVLHIRPPVVYCSRCARRLDLGVKESQYVSLYISAAGPLIYYNYSPNPSASLHFEFALSTPGVASVSPSTADWKSAQSSSGPGQTNITGLAEGDTTLIVRAPDGFIIDPGAALAIHVGRRTPRFPDVDAGKDLATAAVLRMPTGTSGSFTLTVADPSLALLSFDNRSAGQKSLSYGSSQAATVYVQGLADSGQTTITATGAGFDPVTATVRLGPAAFVWPADSLSLVQYGSPSSLNVTPYALDAVTRIPVAAGALRAGVTAAPQINSSDPGVVTVTYPNSIGSVSLQTKAPGSATLSIVQPPGFAVPATRADLPVTVARPSLQLYGGTVGKDLQTTTSISVPAGAPGQVTLTSSDPSKLVLSADAVTPGAASITISPAQGGRFYLQGLDSSGQVTVTAAMPGFVDGSAVFTLAPAAVVINTPYGGPITTTTQSGKTQLSLSVLVVDVTSGKATISADSFRPGVSAPSVTVTSSNPAVGTISGSPVTVNAGYSGGASVTFNPLAPGDTVLTVVQPPGFFAPATGTTIAAHVTPPGFYAVDFTMARDTISAQTAQLGGGVLAQAANLEVTIVSGDPSKLVLSDTPQGATGASLKKVLVAGRAVSDPYYLHALDSQGVVPLTISAPGFADATVKVTLSELVFQFQNGGSSAVRAVMQSGPQKYAITFHAANASSLGYTPPVPIRPGAAPIVVNVSSSDPGTLAVDTPQITILPGATSASVTAHPVSVGPAVLLLDVPGYAVDRTAGYLAVNVEGARLGFNYGVGYLGRDLQAGLSVGSEVTLPPGTPVTITSSDPSRLAVSLDAKTQGQGSVTLLGQSSQVWVQALADNGSVTVTASADGFQPASVQVPLVPSAAVFNGSGSQALFTNSRPQSVSVSLAALDPASLRQVSSNGSPRPGANLTTAVSVSDKAVLAVDVSTVKFDGVSSTVIQVRPTGPGTAVLSLGPLPGGVSPGAAGQISYTVTEPDAYIADFTIGRDLQAQVQLKLGSRIPTPTVDLALKVGPDYSFTVASGAPVTSYPNTATVIVPAGQRVSRPFTVAGLSTNTSTLTVSGPGIANSYSTVTVVGSTFVFQDASPVTVAAGASTNLTVVPALLPLGTPAPAGMTLRDAAPSIAIPVIAASASTLSATPSTLTFKPGDAQATVTVKGLAPGTGTVSLNVPSYGTPNAKSTMNVTVK